MDAEVGWRWTLRHATGGAKVVFSPNTRGTGEELEQGPLSVNMWQDP